jgi:hypothetical protein
MSGQHVLQPFQIDFCQSLKSNPHSDRLPVQNSDRLTMAKANVNKPQQHKEFINTAVKGFTNPGFCCSNERWIVIGYERQLIFDATRGNRGQLNNSTNLENFYVDRLAHAQVRAAIVYIQYFKDRYLPRSPYQLARVIALLPYEKRGIAHA